MTTFYKTIKSFHICVTNPEIILSIKKKNVATYAFFINKKFRLDEIVQQYASKFVDIVFDFHMKNILILFKPKNVSRILKIKN